MRVSIDAGGHAAWRATVPAFLSRVSIAASLFVRGVTGLYRLVVRTADRSFMRDLGLT
ncbi:hypothetical protein MPTA5024_04195 [Microbispora sp. ATCC PTA-5024]|nr:hypothetical protein MPTA5024_04195 [Microbispora sp. ATCC PTA-5024]